MIPEDPGELDLLQALWIIIGTCACMGVVYMIWDYVDRDEQ